ncbi:MULTISPECIES: hypothetical protein [unclassified Mesorhizobium]|uniref:hypothetical protein n=1 Tax=unclassified Mesorhizobium TaxID=325217 RepID=UPI00112CB92E|nr:MULTISPECIES: hypothetical protein [unclassified Mesorhizobium]TPI11706.1 hypothetical protein FJW10_28170 [Mesorhizobium sp. B4-1-1]TPL36031.1 hypothetical protein FJ957_29995 [Mesorhizobium sp. B2-4-6]
MAIPAMKAIHAIFRILKRLIAKNKNHEPEIENRIENEEFLRVLATLCDEQLIDVGICRQPRPRIYLPRYPHSVALPKSDYYRREPPRH